jgi:hypothetical protein
LISGRRRSCATPRLRRCEIECPSVSARLEHSEHRRTRLERFADRRIIEKIVEPGRRHNADNRNRATLEELEKAGRLTVAADYYRDGMTQTPGYLAIGTVPPVG